MGVLRWQGPPCRRGGSNPSGSSVARRPFSVQVPCVSCESVPKRTSPVSIADINRALSVYGYHLITEPQ
ncbi:unnamed protein product, partial [Nesidiocoris tenuis]